jgi:hypothetical protein
MAPTRKQLAARHMRRLRTMRKSLLDMAAQWDDVDQFCMTSLEELADQAENIAVNLVDDAEDGGAS